MTGRHTVRDPLMRPENKGLRSDRMLNYVWIDKTLAPEPKGDEPLSSVPLHYFDKAFTNARRYPDTQVNIWMDYDLLNLTSRFFVESHVYMEAPENVVLRNLRDIPRYANNPLFDRHKSQKDFASIWSRVDLARFLAIEYCLSQSDIDEAFYADFDMEDVDLDNPLTKLRLQKRGLTLAFVEVRDVAQQLLDIEPQKIMAHGFIAVDRSAHVYIKVCLLDELEKGAEHGNVFKALVNALYDRKRSNKLKDFFVRHENHESFFQSYTTDVKLPPMGKEMDRPALYEEIGLCGFKFRG